MQDLSYHAGDPEFQFNGLRFTVQVFTFENVYGLQARACTVTETDREFAVSCSELTWAGGQESAPGYVKVSVTAAGARQATFAVEAGCATKTIRCVKLTLLGLPMGDIINLPSEPHRPIPPEGLILRYPEGWNALYTPLVVLQGPGSVVYARSLDTQVREKRFAFIPTAQGLNLELIFEETATAMATSVTVPPWAVGTSDDPAAIYREHARHVERAYGLRSWEERSDVPDWARSISLVAAIHCQHWSGHIFNDYEAVLAKIQWIARRIDPRQVLVYLPGWEGRYYWQYGDYRPDPRMGGVEGFRRLMDVARQLGVRMMPMFGINVVNRGMENFEYWGGPAITSSAGGVPTSGSVDWDGSRHYDHAWNVMLNPGAPTWQNRLVGQIEHLADTYGFDGVFLDISAFWLNDPRHHTYEGVVQLCRRLRTRHPEMLVAGEGWYDAISLATPLVQAGHVSGSMRWHDEPCAELFTPYNRGFAHLCMGDPGQDSTGVHELGRNPFKPVPFRKGLIPTVTMVGDTLQRAPEAVEAVIDSARRYAAEFIDRR